MIAAVRIKGRVNVPQKIKDTLDMLRLRQKFVCSLYKETPQVLGMLKKAKAYISYGKINEATLKQLLLKRGRKEGDKSLTEQEASNAFKKIHEGKLEEAYKEGLKPFFRLSPPKGGFKKNSRLVWPQGIRGNLGDKINELIESML